MIRAAILITLMGVWLCPIAAAQPVDFETDIRPILSKHCMDCHNPGRKEGGLSLDTVEAARLGGDSGRSALGGTQQTNEILSRVTSEDPDERMPLEADPLSAAEIDLLTQWVDAGTPWPKQITDPGTAAPSVFRTVVERWIRPYAVWLGGLLVIVLLIERVKSVFRKRTQQGQKDEKQPSRALSMIGPPIYVIAGLCLLLGILAHQIFLLEARIDAAKANQYNQAHARASITELFGDPPVPKRPSHEPRIGGTYYRGNNERKPELYNNGHYRTASLELSLIDAQGETLTYGSEATSGLSIRLLIERAPQATPLLFSEDIMSGLLLTAGYHPEGATVSGNTAVTFTPADRPDAWVATFPIKLDPDESSGLIYLYRGSQDAEGNIKTTGMPQIGIVYDLVLNDGKIATGSELWMDAIYFPENILPPAPEGMVPWNEWLDYRPIPIIKGEHTADPDLLGVNTPDGEAQPNPQD